MKKIIAIFMVLLMVTCIFAGCANNNNSPTGTKPTTTAPNTDPTEQVDVMHITDLKPTGSSVELKHVKLTDDWSTTNTITSISHVNGGKYMYMADNLPVFANEWDDIKNVKLADLTKQANATYHTISVMKTSGNISNSIFNIVFDEETESLTIDEAYNNGLYNYTIASAGGEKFDSIVEEVCGENENPIQTFIDAMGQPTSVFYTDFEEHITFTIVYTFSMHSLVLTGYEKTGDNIEGNRIWLDSIQICGNGSYAFKEATTATETKIQLK